MARVIEWIKSPTGAVVAAVVTIALVAMVAFSGGDDDEGTGPAQTVNAPDPVSASELAALAESLGQPVYWAGPQGATQFDLTRQGTERIVVTYPPANGGSQGGSLTVGTYRLDDAEGAIRRAAEADTAKLHRLPGRGLAVSDSARPTNVYFAYPDASYQVEVFDPKPGRALRLVLGREIKPVR